MVAGAGPGAPQLPRPSALRRLILVGGQALAQACGPHVRPGTVKVGKAFGLRAPRPDHEPAGGQFPPGRPDRILFLVVPHYAELAPLVVEHATPTSEKRSPFPGVGERLEDLAACRQCEPLGCLEKLFHGGAREEVLVVVRDEVRTCLVQVP